MASSDSEAIRSRVGPGKTPEGWHPSDHEYVVHHANRSSINHVHAQEWDGAAHQHEQEGNHAAAAHAKAMAATHRAAAAGHSARARSVADSYRQKLGRLTPGVLASKGDNKRPNPSKVREKYHIARRAVR